MSIRACSLRRLLGRLMLVAVVVALLAAGWPSAPQANADGPDWELTALTGNALRLFPTTSGVLYAQIENDLYRSDDAGVSWSNLSLPPMRERKSGARMRQTAIGSGNASTLFVDGKLGVYRSVDDGATWTVLTLSPDVGTWVESLAVSPANPSLVYVWVTETEYPGNRLALLRSHDAGSTWDIIRHEKLETTCRYRVSFFWPHPRDTNRAYSQWGCHGISSKIGSMSHSADGGATWSTVTTISNPLMGRPGALAGGQGVQPDRFYLVTHPDTGPLGQRVWRSDSGVDEWHMVFEQPDVSPRALAYHPETPDHVYLGVVGHKTLLAPGAVLESTDAGDTWTPLGQRTIGGVHDLALAPDGRQLYAANSQGVYRIRFNAQAAPPDSEPAD